MASAVRSCVPVRSRLCALVLAVGVAGCTPAAWVQRTHPVQQCDVRVCTNLDTGLARCVCTTHAEMMRQTRHGFWPHTE